MRNVSKGVNIAIPLIVVAFIQIHHTSRGTKKEIKGLKEIPGNLRGCDPQHDGIVSEESVVNGLKTCFKRET